VAEYLLDVQNRESETYRTLMQGVPLVVLETTKGGRGSMHQEITCHRVGKPKVINCGPPPTFVNSRLGKGVHDVMVTIYHC